MSASPIRVGVAGLGRSGWNIHVAGLRKWPELFTIAAVMDLDPARRAEAEREFGCKGYEAFEDLAADRDVEVVVVASPNRFHADHAIAAMRAGKHAVVEKPFALSAADADRMIEASRQAKRVLAPFQNRRYESHFRKVKEIVDSGVLGDIVLIRLAVHGFGRRWDWQTLREFGGGQLNNWGPHILDHALQLLGPDDPSQLFVDLRNTLSSGDAEDHVKIVMKAGGPTVDIEITSAAAMGQERWLVMGTAGGLRGGTNKLEWKRVDWEEMPERPVEKASTADRGYNREQLDWQGGSWEGGDGEDQLREWFYRDLFDTIRKGEPLFISAESVRRQIALIERCHAQCPVLQMA